MAGFLGNKKAVTSAVVDTAKGVERGGATMPDNTLANMVVERIDYRDASDSDYQVQKNGKEACENAINLMLRIEETRDGKYLRKCIFHTFFLASDNSTRAAKDQEILAMLVALAVENDRNLAGLHEEIFDGDEWPSDESLKELIGTKAGVTIGVFTGNDGRNNEFIRKIGKPFTFGSANAGADAGNGGPAPTKRVRRQRA